MDNNSNISWTQRPLLESEFGAAWVQGVQSARSPAEGMGAGGVSSSTRVP